EDGIAAQSRNIERTYGRPIADWISLVQASGLSRHPEIVAMLKTEHGMTHGAAHRVALLARDAAAPPQQDPVATLYAGRKAGLRPIHESSSPWSANSAATSPRRPRRAISAFAAPASSPWSSLRRRDASMSGSSLRASARPAGSSQR